MYTHIMAQDCVCAHHPVLVVIYVERLVDRLFSLSVPRFIPFRVSLLSLALLFSNFYLHSVLDLFFHVDNAKAINHGASAN